MQRSAAIQRRHGRDEAAVYRAERALWNANVVQRTDGGLCCWQSHSMLTRFTLRKILRAPGPQDLGGPDRSLDTHDVLVRSETNILR